jgi:hypothetical protein
MGEDKNFTVQNIARQIPIALLLMGDCNDDPFYSTAQPVLRSNSLRLSYKNQSVNAV